MKAPLSSALESCLFQTRNGARAAEDPEDPVVFLQSTRHAAIQGHRVLILKTAHLRASLGMISNIIIKFVHPEFVIQSSGVKLGVWRPL
jgi:hypothetical protein